MMQMGLSTLGWSPVADYCSPFVNKLVGRRRFQQLGRSACRPLGYFSWDKGSYRRSQKWLISLSELVIFVTFIAVIICRCRHKS